MNLLKVILSIIFFFSFEAHSVSFSEQRIIFEGNKRTHSMRMSNNSNQAITYHVNLREAKMMEKGEIVFLDRNSPPSHSASKLIRFSPRKGLLQPGQTQIIRFMIRKHPELNAGEYYSFLKVLSRPVNDKPQSYIGLSKQIGYNLPIFVRHQLSSRNTKIWLDNANIRRNKKGKYELLVWLNREGLRSVSGTLTVNDDNQSLLTVSKIGLYTDVKKRRFVFPLSGSPSGKIKVNYIENKNSGNLSASLNLPEFSQN